MLGVMPTREAMNMAAEKHLDLVQIVPNAVPTVCKLMDYGKYLYEKTKKDKEAKKKQKTIDVKEIRLSAKIEKHDFEFKVKNAYKFLESGDKVKVSIRFRGREMQYTKAGAEVLGEFAEAVKDVGTLEKKPQLEGRNMMVFINPIKPE